MAHGVLGRRIDLAEGLRHAVGDKDRIVAKTLTAARRKDEVAVHLAFEDLHTFMRRCERQHADELRRAVAPALGFEFVFDALHRKSEVLPGPAPAGGMDAGRAAQRRHLKSGIVGKCGVMCRLGGGARLQHGIAGEAVFGFFRFVQAKFIGADDMQAPGREQLANLAHLALIVARHHQRIAAAEFHAAMTPSCSVTSSAMPLRASLSMWANCSSLNGAPSAGAFSSTRPPLPVSTKIASGCALESSS